MSKKQITCIIIVVIIVITFGAICIYKSFDGLTSWISGVGHIDKMIIGWALVLGIFYVIYGIFKKDDIAKRLCLAAVLFLGNWLFLSFYYITVTNFLVKISGIEPRMIIGVQTLCISLAVGVLWYLFFNALKVEPGAWKGYAIISIFGSLIIAYWMWFQPHILFAHATNIPEKIQTQGKSETAFIKWFGKNKTEEFWIKRKITGRLMYISKKDNSKVIIKNKDGDFVQPKCWLLRDDKSNKIIDVSYSPGNSVIYGRRLSPGTPADALEIMKFREKNSKNPIYRMGVEKKSGTNPALASTKTNYKIYPPGTYTFSLKANQRTDHWIQLTDGVYYSVKSDDDKFKLLYFDGKMVPAWTPGNWPNKSKFKIIAVTDQPEIKLAVR